MSVPENERDLSGLEFYHNAIVLRREITLLLLRDFGVKDKVRNTKLLAQIHHIDPDDEAALRGILEKYNMENSIIEEYPQWLIDHMRTGIMNVLRSLILNITAANSIYPTNEAEYYERRVDQDRAIGNCEQLYQEMQYAISVLPVDAEKYMHYVGMIEKEIALLKGWRKADNKILTRIKKQEAKEKEKAEGKKPRG